MKIRGIVCCLLVVLFSVNSINALFFKKKGSESEQPAPQPQPAVGYSSGSSSSSASSSNGISSALNSIIALKLNLINQKRDKVNSQFDSLVAQVNQLANFGKKSSAGSNGGAISSSGATNAGSRGGAHSHNGAHAGGCQGHVHPIEVPAQTLGSGAQNVVSPVETYQGPDSYQAGYDYPAPVAPAPVFEQQVIEYAPAPQVPHVEYGPAITHSHAELEHHNLPPPPPPQPHIEYGPAISHHVPEDHHVEPEYHNHAHDEFHHEQPQYHQQLELPAVHQSTSFADSQSQVAESDIRFGGPESAPVASHGASHANANAQAVSQTNGNGKLGGSIFGIKSKLLEAKKSKITKKIEQIQSIVSRFEALASQVIASKKSKFNKNGSSSQSQGSASATNSFVSDGVDFSSDVHRK